MIHNDGRITFYLFPNHLLVVWSYTYNFEEKKDKTSSPFEYFQVPDDIAHHQSKVAHIWNRDWLVNCNWFHSILVQVQRIDDT